MIWSLLLTPCVATAYTYFVYLQLYVSAAASAKQNGGEHAWKEHKKRRRLRIDVIMNAIGLIFLGLELPFQLVVCFHFSTAIYI